MEPIVLKPEREQKTMWFICWAIPFVIVLVFLVVLLLFAKKEAFVVFALCLIGWLIVMSLILLWIPTFFSSLEYIVDNDSVKVKAGVFWKKRVTVPYTKITNIDVTQGPLQRMFEIGTIHVQTAGAGGTQGAQAELKLLGVRDLDEVKDAIMARVRSYTISRPEQIKEKVPEESDLKIFRRMLEELTAIRELLQNKQR